MISPHNSLEIDFCDYSQEIQSEINGIDALQVVYGDGYNNEVDVNENIIDDEPLDVQAPSIVSEDVNENSNDDECLDIQDPLILSEEVDYSASLVGVKAKELTSLCEVYKRHSRQIGFGVRLYAQRTRDGCVYEKYLVCSCQGLKETKKRKSTSIDNDSCDNNHKAKERKSKITRTNCKAMARIKLNKEGLFVIVDHVIEHNHVLTPKEWQHFHRSERSIPNEERDMIKVMTQAGMPPVVQYRYLVESCGGEENLGWSKKDHINTHSRIKAAIIENGDAQTVVDMLIKMSEQDPSFFWRLQVGEGNRVTNLFWRDGRMKDDYLLYYDVLIFDTTYRTNKYNLICGAFVGINNHWSNVMFGSAFISDEKTESFEWLFNVFNESMGGIVVPKSIFTDQDQAMTNAIEKVFPHARHRLCQWHIQQNAMSHFGTLKKDPSFQKSFNKCLRGCYNEAEFEDAWNLMIDEYKLSDNSWFKRLYSIRTKWSTAFNKDFFSAGILSSQRSESTNHAMSFQANKTTSLTDFYGIFGETVKRWRSVEEKNEFECIRSNPTPRLPGVPLLIHAASVYTHNLYKRVEEEIIHAVGSISMFERHMDTLLVYQVHHASEPNYIHRVIFNIQTFEYQCTCKKWEECGLVCFHAFRVFLMHNVTNIPEKCIAKRWSKFAKLEVWERMRELHPINTTNKDGVNWRREMQRKFFFLLLKGESNPEARAIIDTAYNTTASKVGAVFDKSNVVDTDVQLPGTMRVLDPTKAKTKGRNVRIKRQNKKKSNVNQPSQAGVITTYTPNERLI